MPAIREADYLHAYKHMPTPYTIWSNQRGDDPIETIVFLGTIQIGELGKWVAESCPPNTIVVQGAPHWTAQDDGSDIPEYMLDFTNSVFDTLLKKFSITKVHIIAESQAAPAVLYLFGQKAYIPSLKKLTLIQPLGLNARAYSGTEAQRVETFKRRIVANFIYQLTALVIDARLRHNHRTVGRITGGARLHNPKARAQYGSGLAHDATSSLKVLYEHHKEIVIICGTKDKLFPPTEIAATLAANGIDIPLRTIKGVPHSPLATRYGQRLLRAAFA